jgi:hypothetical protein
MKVGDHVRATYPYGGVPACHGSIISKLILGNRTQFLVRFEVRPSIFKQFYLTERELTLCSVPDAQGVPPAQSPPQTDT